MEAMKAAAQVEAMGYEVMPAYDGSMRVLVLMDKEADTYDKGGLIEVPDNYKKIPLVGTIVAKSPVRPEDEPCFPVEIGMRVLVQYYDAKELTLNIRDGLTKFRLLHLSDIYVKWVGDEMEAK